MAGSSQMNVTSAFLQGGIRNGERLHSEEPLVHPYQKEIAAFELTAVHQIFPLSNRPPLLPLEETPLVMVEDRIGLENMVRILETEREIGVDVEYSDHGFMPVVCLIQISTSTKDFIIDTLKVNRHDIKSLLTGVLVNPRIVKIFHDSLHDLKWLQQHFDLYVVNMFDTSTALSLLGCCQTGLQWQLQKYNVFVNKKLQLADFRRRPLPTNMIFYARSDAHFLIDMYYELWNELFFNNDKTLLQRVIEDCIKSSKVIYKVDLEQPAYVKFEKFIEKKHPHKLLAVRQLNSWRHRIAEHEDINPGRVLSIKALKNFINVLPDNVQQVKMMGSSKYVSRAPDEILQLLASAKQPSPMERNRKREQHFSHGHPKRFRNDAR